MLRSSMICFAAGLMLSTAIAPPTSRQTPDATSPTPRSDLDIKAAHQRSKSPRARLCAPLRNDMVRDHTAVNDKALALVKKLNVTPEDNDTSKALVTQANERKPSFQSSQARPSTRRTSRMRSRTTRLSTTRSRRR